MKINCIVVDDSSIQRLTITKLVNDNPNLELVGEFSNAVEAKNCITNKNVDLVFLDIEMPVINGFDLLDGLKVKPQVIFITSKAEYAVKAFDYAATDYLHKPITRERFNQAVKKAISMISLSKENGVKKKVRTSLSKVTLKNLKFTFPESNGLKRMAIM
jgi:two-component SAPR family response regulator